MIEPFQSALRHLVDNAIEVLDIASVSGGCISDGHHVKTSSCDHALCSLFVKRNDESFLGNFQAEASGLNRLSVANSIGVPKPITCGVFGGKSWLVLPWVEQVAAPRDFFTTFGQQLATLHRETRGSEIGAAEDNFLGASRQLNQSCHSWAEFVAVQRIGVQLQQAVNASLADAQLVRDCESIIENIDELLEGREEYTSLLHGDLWSGNYLCDSAGQPVLIDPAVYRGCREAEFGMLLLFGSCPAEFYDSYLAEWTLPSGWRRRANIYILYHLLNHLNLFGGGYLSQCRSVAQQVLRRGEG